MESRILTQEEKKDSRTLYEECFPEDSQVFTDYYYQEKIKDNVILAGFNQESNHELQTMIHLNPFNMIFCEKTITAHYIVAVATAKKARKQGLMRGLMKEAFYYLYELGNPFTFLMPANPDYYRSLGFRFWKSQYVRILEKDFSWDRYMPLEELSGIDDHMSQDKYQGAADYANTFLARNYNLYVLRSAAYYRRLVKEYASQNGHVMVEYMALQENSRIDDINGIFCYSNEEYVEVNEPLITDGSTELQKSICMGRIIHLKHFVDTIRSDKKIVMNVGVKDDIIQENNGAFSIIIDKDHASISEISPDQIEEVIDIGDLGERLFSLLRIFVNEIV